MLEHVTVALMRRAMPSQQLDDGGAVGQDPSYDVPAWSFLVLLVNMIVIIPLFILVSYTISEVFPVFAMVEDEKPPAYEPVALDDGFPEAGDEATRQNSPKPTAGDAKAVSSSLRAMSRLLRVNGGFWAHFRGFFCRLAQSIMTGFLVGIFIGALGENFSPIATLLASLTLVQFSTAWVHIILTKRSNLHFWQRLPPFKRTFNATWKPVVLYWAALESVRWLPVILIRVVDISIPNVDPSNPTRVHGNAFAFLMVAFALIFGVLAAAIFIIIPARVVLYRIQASLLPAEEETIIPFDRTFDGRVDPVVVSGKGYATIADAWATFSKAAWRRLVILHIKIVLVTFAIFVLLGSLTVPQAFIISRFSERTDGSTDL